MNLIQRISIISGALGVAIGAFGAHALRPFIETNARGGTWDTAMHYYWIHTLALLAVSFSCKPQKALNRVASFWLVSILLFCGSLMALSLGAPSPLGAITPLGGIGFILGWISLLWIKLPE